MPMVTHSVMHSVTHSAAAPPVIHPSAARARCGPPRIIRGEALVASPWKNGGGATREIAVHPAGAGFDTFDWRVSVADVERSGPFSRFAGVDRTLVLLSEAGMRLVDERGMAQTALTEPFAFVRFPGELAVQADLVDGPTRDFNLMLRRARTSAAVELWRDAGVHALDVDVLLVFCADGALDVTVADAAPVRLAAMDTLQLDAAGESQCVVSGTGAAIAVGIRYLDQRS